MSGTIFPLSTVRVSEPRVKINEERQFAILSGGSQVSWKPYTTTSFSTTSIQFTTPPPNPNIIVDRKVLLRMFFTLTFVGDTTDPLVPLLSIPPAGSADAPRAYPLSNGIINTMAVNINNTQVSINMNDVMAALLWYNTPPKERYRDYSMTASMLDRSQAYSDLFGQVLNPLGQYGDNVMEVARGGFVGYTVLTNTQTSATVSLEVTEPIFLSPFVFGCGNQSGFEGVQTMDWNLTLGDLTRLWSHDSVNGNVATFTSLTVTLPTSPQLLFNYITPKELMPLPRAIVYPYFNVERYPTDFGNVLAGASATVSSNNIQLQSIPSRLYIFIRRRNADKTLYTTDTFARIDTLQLNWNNRSGLFSSATSQDLYRMSVDNGLETSWTQWYKQTGSVLCIEFGKDVGLDDLEAPGLLGTYQLQMNIAFTNPSAATINYTLYIVPISTGTFSIADNRAVAQVGVVTKGNILDSKTSPEVSYKAMENIYGGNIFAGIKEFIGKAASKIGEILPYVGKAVGVAKLLTGMGSVGAGVVGGRRPRRKMRGGELISRSELRSALGEGY